MFSDPQFWVFIAFIIFIGAITKPVRKILSINLGDKIQEIKNSINEAEKLRNESQLTLIEIKKRQNEVKKEIELIQKDIKEKISIIELDAHSKLEEQIKKRNIIALMKIDQMTRDANNEVREHLTQSAIATVIDILDKKLDSKEKQNLINQSIDEIDIVIKH